MGSVFAVFGLNSSMVRELSRCNDDKNAIGKVYYIVNRLVLIFCALTFLIIFLFAGEIGLYLFNNSGYTSGIRCVAFIIIFAAYEKIGYSVLNGTHRLKKLAISQIISSCAGSIGIILAVFIWKDNAIPGALSIIFIVMTIITFFYVRKEGIREIKASWDEFKLASYTLLYIGAGVCIAGIISTVMTIMSKSYLTANYSLSAVGFYQASWTVSNLYTGIVLTAMGVDFMPRLSKIIDKKKEASEMINQQIIFGMVFVSIAITGILLFSKEILYILYSKEFEIASIIIRWHILGVFLRVIAFPFSYTILAKGDAKLYAIIQTLFWVGDYLLLRLCSSIWGFDGLGINYPIAYSCFLALTCFAARKICNFRFDSEVIKVFSIICIFICLAWVIAAVDIKSYYLRYTITIVLLICQIVYIYNYMKKKMGLNIKSILHRKK